MNIQYFVAYFIAVTSLLTACKVEQVATTQPPGVEDPNVSHDSVLVDSSATEAKVIDEPGLPYRSSEPREHDLLHTRLEIQFDWENHHLLGKATLQLKPYFYPQSTLVLDAKGFDIHSINLVSDGAEESRSKPLNYQYDSLIISIQLDKTYQRDEPYWVSIDYTAKPDEFTAGGSTAITSDKGLYFIDDPSPQIWTQGETEAGSRWFPTIDIPSERSTQEMFITVDDRYVTLSNGTLVYSQVNESSSSSDSVLTRTDYWKMDQPHAPYLFMVAVGEFAVVEDQWKDMPVNYYLDSAYAPYAKDIFGRTPQMLSFFSDKLGVTYPWPKYSQVIVRDFVSGAMENTTASVFYDALLVDDRELLDDRWDGIIAHELFHHWFGDLVTCESWANLPLNESFATYGEYLWSEHYYGKDEAEYVRWEQLQNYLSEAEDKQVDLIRFHYADQEEMFDRHSYDKGSLVLHMLRNYVGDAAFFTALERYLTQHAYSSVEIHNLRMAFEEVTGQDLNWFFNQWFLSSGHPKFQVDHAYEHGTLTISVVQLQDLESTPLYQIPVSVDVWVNNTRRSYELWIDREEQEFQIELSATPQLVLFDSDASLLAEVNHDKSSQEWMYQFRNTDSFVQQLASLRSLVNDSTTTLGDTILHEALENDFWVIRRLAINALEDRLTDEDTQKVNQLSFLAEKDEKSLVRADALNALASINPEQYRELFLASLQDSSYAVVGTAIAGYAQTSATDKNDLFDQFIDYKNFNVVMALADYYVANAVEGKLDWFQKKAQEVSEETLYYLINYMAQYLAIMNDEKLLEQGIPVLADYARNHSKYYIRLTAYRGLLFFSENPEVEALIESIAAGEPDEKLRKLYQSNAY